MNILLTGHKGFIGQNLLKALKDKDHHVTGFEWGNELPELDFDVVMHIGSISSTNEKNVDKILTQNYEFSIRLLEECSARGINFQYSSSASVYGRGKTFSEEDMVDPQTPYAWSKYLFERYIANRKFNIVIQGFRYFNVYGPGESHKLQPSPHEAFSRQQVIKLFYGSDKIYRDFVPVEKVVNTHIEFMKVPESGIWNIGTGNPKSFLEIAESFNKPIEYIDMPVELKSNYQYYTCANIDKLNRTISKYALDIPTVSRNA